MNSGLKLLCFFQLFVLTALAQPPCIDFENFSDTLQYGPISGYAPGDHLFNQSGIDVSIQEILYPDGSTDMLNTMFYNTQDINWPLDGQFIFLGNNSLVFDFSGLNYPSPVQVCFDFFDGGGEENFAINGAPVSVLFSFSEVANLNIPGVEIEVTLNGPPGTFVGGGSVCLTGNIETLLLGGQEFGLDNICITPVANDCPLANLEAAVVGCNDDGSYDVLVDFEWTSPLTVIEHFDIYVEGEHVAFIAQNEVPYLLEGVQVFTDALNFELRVCQNDHPDCCLAVAVPKNCPPPASDCIEFEALEEGVYGSSSGTQPGQVIYTENNVNLMLIPFQSLFWFTVYGDMEVINTADAPQMSQASGRYLRFESINAVFDLTQYPDPIDSVVVDFYYSGGQINLAANGATPLIQNQLQAGFYSLAPGITLDIIFNNASGSEGQLIFTGNVQSLLIGGQGDFRIDNLCINPTPQECLLSNLSLNPQPCTPNGIFYLEVDFDYAHTASDSFQVWHSLGGVQEHAYADLPILVGPYPSGIANFPIYINDLENVACVLEDTLFGNFCNPCADLPWGIANIVGQNAAGQSIVEVSVGSDDPSTTGSYAVYFNDQFLGNYSGNNFTLTLPCSTTNEPILTVCSNASDVVNACCIAIDFGSIPLCNDCQITDVTVTTTPCDPNGGYSLTLDFNHSNTSDLFQVWLEGTDVVYSFEYSELPVQIGPFFNTNPASVVQVLHIQDAENPDCQTLFTFVPPCNTTFCPWVGLTITPGACTTASGQFFATLNMIPLVDANLPFYVETGGYFEEFHFDDLPVTIGPFEGNGQQMPIFVFSNDDFCTDNVVIQAPNCNQNCNLGDFVNLDTVWCNNSNTYTANIFIEGAQPGDVFTVSSAVTGHSANFAYGNVLLNVSGFPIAANQQEILVICLAGSNCCVDIAFDVPCPSCIYNVQTEVLPCNNDGLFYFELSFLTQYFSHFFVEAGDYLEDYQYQNLPVTIGPFEGNGQTITYTIYSEQSDCAYTGTIVAPNCNDNCNLNGQYEFSIFPACANPAGSDFYFASILLGGAEQGDVFTITSYLSNYSYTAVYGINGLPYEMINLGNNFDYVQICTVNTGTAGDPNCCISMEYDVACPPCFEPSYVGYHLTPCNSDGQFEIVIDSVLLTTPTLSLQFFAHVNGNTYGPFSIFDLPVSIGSFPGNNAGYQVTITVSNSANCGYSFYVPPVNCNGNCTLNEAYVVGIPSCPEPGSDFYTVAFEIPGAQETDFFTVTSELTGVSLTAVYEGYLFVELPNTNMDYDEVIICAGNDPACCVQIAYDISCPPCIISDLVLEANPCSNTGTFTFDLDFNVQGATSDTFYIQFSNGDIFGFQLEDLPVTLGSLPGNGEEFFVWVYDASETCVANATLQAPNCDPNGCPLGPVTIETGQCNADGYFTAILNIDLTNDLNGQFFVETDDYLEDFNFANLPVTIGPFPGNGQVQDVVVYTNQFNCQSIGVMQAPDCNPGGCNFTSVVAEPYDCNDGQFMIDVEVHVNEPGILGYFIFVDGQIFGPYSYSAPFVTVGPFVGDGTTIYDVLILDIEDPSCFGYTEVGPIACDNTLCDIYDLEVFNLQCHDDGTYSLSLNFHYTNPGNDFFDVYDANGNLIGFYPLNQLPITIEHFGPGNGQTDALIVCINDQPNCCADISFQAPECGNTGDCSITDLNVSLAYCDEDGFYVQIDFGYQNVGNEGYRVRGNGNLYGNFNYDAPFPIIGPFPSELDIVWELIVIDNQNEDCRDAVTFSAMDCTNSSNTCIQFEVFNNLEDTLFLADFGEVNEAIYTEDHVTLWSRPITWINNTNYFGGAIVYNEAACGLDFDGAWLYVSGGLEFDFSAYAVPPQGVSFNMGFNCTTNATPVFYFSINGDSYEGSINDLPDFLGDVEIILTPISPAIGMYSIELIGEVNSLSMGAISFSIDNICFEGAQLAEADNCLDFSVFDLTQIDTLAINNQPQQMDYTEAGVYVTAQAIEWNGLANYFTGVYATNGFPCGFGDDDAALQFGGGLNFDFSGLNETVVRTTFEISFCPGQTNSLRFGANDETFFGSIFNLQLSLPNGIDVVATPISNTNQIWQVVVEGPLEHLFLGGNLTLDNLCYELEAQVEEVWPGDANSDNIANHIDLLNVGLTYGYQGPARFEDAIVWTSLNATNWSNDFADGLNHKHADCNGDGVINAADRDIIALNYGLTHGVPEPFEALPATSIDPPVFVDFPNQIPNQATFDVPIIVGSADSPVEDVYGIAFEIHFNPLMIDPSAIVIQYDVSWLGEPGVNQISIDRIYPADGVIQVAITRTDHNNVSGFGKVARIIGIIDDIAGLHDDRISIENIVGIDHNEQPKAFNGLAIPYSIDEKEDEPEADEMARGAFTVYPNPSDNWVNIVSIHGFPADGLELIGLDGRRLEVPQEENQRISLAGLPSGSYILRIHSGKSTVHKLIIKR
ncbi:MAG TPA: T9SS type A sorting domain-containing protein [Saprospiraceae bacterium]|nr:T9SS type A sorting domain-containing protein [Saprospiraceae bacterium]HMQ83917.1 T9SS type A sorting domain-containing protein [Saprospiraceae bacterium]